MKTRTSLLGQGFGALFVLLLAGSASAQPARAREARKACLGGDYLKGVNILAELYVDSKDLTYIFNQGRCFEQNRRYEDAIARFREYLTTGEDKLDASDKAAAEKRIANCREMLAQERSTAAPPFTPPAPVEPSVATETESIVKPEPTAESTPAVTTEAPPPVASSNGAGLRVAGIVVASVGVAALATGVLLNVKASSTLDSMYLTPDGYADKESERKNLRTLAWVGYGVGAACLTTGVVLLGVGIKARNKANSGRDTDLALVPMWGPGAAGAILTGAF